MTLHMKWIGLIAVAAVAALFVGSGCGKGQFSSNANGPKKNVLRYSLNTTPTQFDPATVQDGDTIDLIQNIFEGLTTWGEDNKPTANLAEKWDISPDGRTYTRSEEHTS